MCFVMFATSVVVEFLALKPFSESERGMSGVIQFRTIFSRILREYGVWILVYRQVLLLVI